MTNAKVQRYLTTLRRVPDDVILATATRPVDLADPFGCLVAWVSYEGHARDMKCDAGERPAQAIYSIGWLVEHYDDFDGWMAINHAFHAARTAAALEDAFTLRVMEAAGVA
jgi:hypothetical protein